MPKNIEINGTASYIFFTFMFISGHSLARTQGIDEMPRPDVNMEVRRMMIMIQSDRSFGMRLV